MHKSTIKKSRRVEPSVLMVHKDYPHHWAIVALSDAAFRAHFNLMSVYTDPATPATLAPQDLAPFDARALEELAENGLIHEDETTPGRYHVRQNIRGVTLFQRGPRPKNPARRNRIPTDVREAVYKRDGFKCVRCGTSNHLSLDHIFPWSLGGSDDPDNLQTMCRPCNSRKGAKVDS